MKRALLGCSAAVIFGLVILGMSILSATAPERVFPSESVVVGQEETVKSKIEYYLPYPGVLPDSPLYKIKALRDQVSLILTFNKLTRAGKELLYADKRIGAAEALVNGGKHDLGASTATKAEKYLEKAVADAEKMTREGKDVKSLLLRLSKAVARHREILTNILGRVSGSQKEVVEEALKINQLLGERVAQAFLEK